MRDLRHGKSTFVKGNDVKASTDARNFFAHPLGGLEGRTVVLSARGLWESATWRSEVVRAPANPQRGDRHETLPLSRGHVSGSGP
jgi:hypothetical protein